MSSARITVLSGSDIDFVHQRSLDILHDPGILVRSKTALSLLEAHGATVDKKLMRAHLPERLVNDALHRLPDKVLLASRNPSQDMSAPRASGPPFMATNGTAVFVRDIDTGDSRASTAEDLRKFMVVCDAMESLDYVWPIVTAGDLPPKGHSLAELAISLLNTTKHVQGEAMSAEEARAEVQVGAIIAGGEDELRERPLFSVIQCPICPLEFEGGSVDAVIEFAKAGIPVVSMSMALPGLTSPVTLAGTIAVVNAENLASFVISQMAEAGAPVVYSSESTAPNLRTGEIHYGAVEELLTSAAATQMANRYGVPSMVGGFCASIAGPIPGITVDPSELVFNTATSFTGTDFASGVGGLDQAKGASLEQVVIDCDIWEMMKQARKEFAMNDERLALDVIRSVGPGGSFLKELHTVKNMRKELFAPSKEKADIYSMYALNKDQTQIIASAKKRVKEILRTHRPEPVHEKERSKIDEIMRRHQ